MSKHLQDLVLPDILAHVTSIESLYEILESGYLKSRSETGADRGLSSIDKGDPNYVYLSLNVENKLIGKVKLSLSSSILNERNDYYLNTDWFYGVTNQSLNSTQLNTWLSRVRGPGEILFKNKIPLNKYLKEIIIPQLSKDIINLIKKSDTKVNLHEVNMNKIPEEYRDMIKIVY